MKRIVFLLSAFAMLVGVVSISAGAANAAVVGDHPVPVSQQFDNHRLGDRPVPVTQQFNRHRPVVFDTFRPRPVPVQFQQRQIRPRFFCTRSDRRLEIWLLFHQRHLNRFQRAELRFLEDICGFPFLQRL